MLAYFSSIRSYSAIIDEFDIQIIEIAIKISIYICQIKIKYKTLLQVPYLIGTYKGDPRGNYLL